MTVQSTYMALMIFREVITLEGRVRKLRKEKMRFMDKVMVVDWFWKLCNMV